MPLPFGIYNLLNPETYIWAQVRILHETDKAILVTAPFVIASEAKQSQNDNIKIWIPKSQICGIKLRKNVFEIYVRESAIG